MRLRFPLEVRLSAVLFVAAAFLAGVGGGLLAAHAFLEADAPLAALEDEGAVRATAGERVRVHGQVVEHDIDTGTGPGATEFTYTLELDDGTARRRFAVPRADHDRIPDGRWIVVPLRWSADGYEPGPPESALQPWMWRAAFGASVVVALAGAASRLSELGLMVKRKGDRLRIASEPKR